ncbi:20310_t:CDS:2 [Gigaspora margarita]|uniref:DNA replication complex GINS protein PSF1 n=2 Tax=Gigaspora margarita TaxID=4874 RepID=A0A8H3X6X9_GIGMA|nr:DNA replication complex gins protein psf1 [Gigaspora margarita]CAG8625349.1 20310_t:CDS:2 [Gigaspora margarita]
MFGETAVPLIDTAKRTRKTQSVSLYEGEKVREILDEISILQEHLESLNDQDLNDINSSEYETKLLIQLVQNHDLKVLKLYHSQRSEKIKFIAIQELPLSQEMRLKLSERERIFHSKYSDLLRKYKCEYPPSLNLSATLVPPKEALTAVRVLKDIGDLMTLNGYVEFRKGTQAIVRKADPTIEKLIKLGYLKIVGNKESTIINPL